ncbi:predicted protein [Histoplasma mississippiense (nom. inval.)]|uniref:predicted protein n=1 Tax=Ajellomyces capsulatus (strain NAm1 / WU24) TaxID=2059318 RepID=UPI000157D5EA|nr:predicted protein [Histoplasma mississippiense (nom. inval.)]EDN05474.1 predicted protein [Histoplasma mississippiense (nom. inval.)]
MGTPNVEPGTKDATWINFNLMTHQYVTQPKAQKPTHKRKKTNTLTAVQPNGTPNIEFTGNSDGHPNKLDKIAWLITELKGIIAQQGQAVETLKTCCEELNADQKELIRQNSSLKDEITALRTQVTHRPDQRSWASIASNSRMNGESSTPPPAPTPASTKADRKDPPLCVCISVAQASDPMEYGGSLTRYLPVEEVKARVTDALQKNTPTKEVKIIRVGITKTGYIIRFRDEASKDTASVNKGWLWNLGNQTKLVRPRFGVVVHRTPTHEVNTKDKPKSMKRIIVADVKLAKTEFSATP